MEGRKGIYHEKQRLQKCAVHTVNNLLQRPAYTPEDFNAICKELSPDSIINPHKALFISGNFDISVVEIALARQGLDLKWFDTRQDISKFPFDSCVGIIINAPVSGFIPSLFKAKHWYPVKRIDGVWYNLDSKLKEPEPLSEEQLRSTLKRVLNDGGVLLYVMPRE